MDIAGQRKALGRHTGKRITERHAAGDRLGRCPEHTRINQLAGRQTLRVGSTGGNHFASGNRDEVGRGGTDVHEQGIGMMNGDDPRRRSPIGGSHRERLRPRIVGRQEAPIDRVDADARAGKCSLHRAQDESHAFALRPEHLRQFRGHRDAVRHGPDAANRGQHLAEQRHQR